jgi:hypothetical protein
MIGRRRGRTHRQNTSETKGCKMKKIVATLSLGATSIAVAVGTAQAQTASYDISETAPSFTSLFDAAKTGFSGSTLFLVACVGLSIVPMIAMGVAMKGRRAAAPK